MKNVCKLYSWHITTWSISAIYYHCFQRGSLPSNEYLSRQNSINCTLVTTLTFSFLNDFFSYDPHDPSISIWQSIGHHVSERRLSQNCCWRELQQSRSDGWKTDHFLSCAGRRHGQVLSTLASHKYIGMSQLCLHINVRTLSGCWLILCSDGNQKMTTSYKSKQIMNSFWPFFYNTRPKQMIEIIPNLP